MSFIPTEEQQAISDAARRFAASRLAPGYRAREQAGALDRALLREMGGLGLIAPEMPESHGGLGQSCVTAGGWWSRRWPMPTSMSAMSSCSAR